LFSQETSLGTKVGFYTVRWNRDAVVNQTGEETAPFSCSSKFFGMGRLMMRGVLILVRNEWSVKIEDRFS